jgi:hypothetical protein
MENFSTPRAALVPRAVNLATLAVVVAATWWSGAQRPAEQPALAQQSIPAVGTSLATPPAAPQATVVQTTTMWRDGLQAVGYQPRATR